MAEEETRRALNAASSEYNKALVSSTEYIAVIKSITYCIVDIVSFNP